MFKRFWNWLSVIGLKPTYDDKLIKRITLTNQFSFIALVVFCLSGINNLILGDIFSGLLLEGFSLVCVLGFVFTKHHRHHFSISFLFTTISFAIFYFDSYSGWASGTYLYYFPLVLAIAFVFDFNADRVKMLVHFFLFLVFILTNVLTRHKLFESLFLTDADRHQMFVFNILFSAAAVGFFIYLTVANNLRENKLFEQRISERKASEAMIQQALTEKEILLAELHHRVKNNLAIISGLFSFTIDASKNDEVKTTLTESKNRVQSMALIHNKLYQNRNLSDINFTQYIEELVDEIRNSYPALKSNIEVKTHIHPVQLEISQAIPCGLILNELLINCYKHAFTGREKGTISISLFQENAHLKLSVTDNGVGLKENYNKTESIGLTVIQSLSEQLDGEYSYSDSEGTRFDLVFAPKNTTE